MCYRPQQEKFALFLNVFQAAGAATGERVLREPYAHRHSLMLTGFIGKTCLVLGGKPLVISRSARSDSQPYAPSQKTAVRPVRPPAFAAASAHARPPSSCLVTP